MRKEIASREGQNEIASAIREITRGVLDIERAETAAEQAESSANRAVSSATALTTFLETKETLTAPAVDKTLAVTGAAADSKVVGDTFKNVVGNRLYIDLLQKDAKCGCQLLKEANSVSNSCWFKNNENKIAYFSTNSAKRWLPVLLYANVKYTFVNVYRSFTLFADIAGNYLGVLSPDTSNIPYTVEYTPSQDCYAYVSKSLAAGYENRQTMLLLGDIYPSDYTEGIFDRQFNIKARDCEEFVDASYQYLKESTAVDNSYWYVTSSNTVGYFSANHTKRYAKVPLKSGVTYTFWNVYGYFTHFADFDGNFIGRLTEDTSNHPVTKAYTPAQDCYAYVSIQKDVMQGRNAMLTNSVAAPTSYTEGLYRTRIKYTTDDQLDIHVKKDGTGNYSRVVDAVNYANSLPGDYNVNIYIHTGTYDILSELGGADFISSLNDSTSELQGLGIWRSNVNLLGVGYPVLEFRLPDTVTRQQSERASCLNLTKYSSKIENLVLIAKNCRYTIHDEGNGYTTYIHRVMKNIRAIHEGNAAGLWAYPNVLGGGNTGGSTYDIINCQFITHNYSRAFSYHCGSEQEPSHYNIDGCLGICNSSTGESFRASYLGTAIPIGKTVFNVKNCTGNGRVIVEPERAGNPEGTENFIELYKNGWETIE